LPKILKAARSSWKRWWSIETRATGHPPWNQAKTV